jgi:hypothetical protein
MNESEDWRVSLWEVRWEVVYQYMNSAWRLETMIFDHFLSEASLLKVTMILFACLSGATPLGDCILVVTAGLTNVGYRYSNMTLAVSGRGR